MPEVPAILRGALARVPRRAIVRAHAMRGDPVARVLLRRADLDPYPLYERVRARGEVTRSALGIYAVTSHRLVSAVLRDPRFGALVSTRVRPVPHPLEDSLVLKDPPEHTWLRRLVMRRFAPGALAAAGERLSPYVDEVMAGLAARRRWDLIEDFAAPITVRAICELIGVPPGEHPRLVALGSVLTLALDRLNSRAARRRLDAAIAELGAFTAELIRYRSRNPCESLMTDLIDGGHLGANTLHREVVATVEFLLIAGFETTVSAIGNAAVALLRDGDLRADFVARSDQSATLIEEALRFEPPVQHAMRRSRQAVELAGLTLPRGATVLLLLAAANRDPAVFDRPHEFDPARPNNREHIAFSGGPHYCLGAGLARLESAAAVHALFARFPDLHLAGRPVMRRSRNVRGVCRLPVRTE